MIFQLKRETSGGPETMAVLTNPRHLFASERLSACSDEAQLNYVRFILTANTLGRSELTPANIRRIAYATIRNAPSDEQILAWLREYRQHFLLFVYTDATGKLWGQWLIPDGYLAKYQTAEDRRSPAPDPDEIESYRQAYYAEKKAKSLKGMEISKPLETVSNHSEESLLSKSGCVANPFEVTNSMEISEISKPSSVTPPVVVEVAVEVGSKPLPYRVAQTIEGETAIAWTPLEYGNFWNSHCAPFAGVHKFTPKRRKKLEASVRAGLTPERFAEAIEKLKNSAFCLGENERGWRASFDFLIGGGNIAKVMDGNYDAAPKPPATRRGIHTIGAGPKR